MVVKLVFVLLLLVVVLALAIAAAYRYFDNQAERKHEKEMQELENTEKLFERDDL
ncbi:hypothetical protein M199_gp139 [Halogranum tailed virus 1]|uniref:Uncharacterized protein n=1 Tax=Halogranum tailed virus 1 TaxID=1273749 RepID=R4TLG1_9CAUD|nr:hypothetical protein M199_gp139 [Halogranum tailed virus 1]AGM11527.1 hypothetical protein HGTV1_230 [Halogranum tailed virus 1]